MKKTLLLLTGLLALSATAMAADATTDAATVTQFKPTGYLTQYLRAYGNKHEGTFKGQKDTGKLYLRTDADATITDNVDVYYRSDNYFSANENQGHKSLYQRTDLRHKWGTLGNSSIAAKDIFRVDSHEAYNAYSIREAFSLEGLFGSSDSNLASIDYITLTPYVTYKDDRNGNHMDTTGTLDLDSYYNLFTDMIPGSLGQELEVTYSQSLKGVNSSNSSDFYFYGDTEYSYTYATLGKTTLSLNNSFEVNVYLNTHNSNKTTTELTDTLTPLKATYQINPSAYVYIAGSAVLDGDDSENKSDKLPNNHTTQLRARIGWHVSF